MLELDAKYPEYGFAKHKGYGTRQHCDALREHCPCPEHRPAFLKKVIYCLSG
jgi:ribonuclease HII